jgi:hypothetical protein
MRKIMKTMVRMSSTVAEIQTGSFLNVNQKHYCLSQLAWWKIFEAKYALEMENYKYKKNVFI